MLPITEKRIEKLVLVTFAFYCPFCLDRLLKNYSFFLVHIALSQLILMIMS